MPTNLTGNTIASTFDQLLHVDDGPTATEKTVYSGTGVATALKVGTESVSVENIQLDGNTIRSLDTNGNINISPNGTGSVAMTKVAITGGAISGITDLAIADGGTGASTAADARTNLGLGTMATQAANNVAITGGSITNVTFTGSFSGMTLVESTTLATSSATAGVNLNGNTLAADGTDTNIDINITPKGTGAVVAPDLKVDNLRLDGSTLSSTNTNGDINLTPNGSGEVNVTNIDVLSGKVPYNVLQGRAYASFSDVTDQTGSVSAATAVKFGTTEIAGAGITMATDGSNLTRLTFAAAGTYMVAPSLQLANSDSNDHDATVWFALNGTNIDRSATRVTVPKAADGGAAYFQIVFYVTVTAGQYVQVMWLPENVAVTLDHTAAGAIAPAVPSTIVVAERIA